MNPLLLDDHSHSTFACKPDQNVLPMHTSTSHVAAAEFRNSTFGSAVRRWGLSLGLMAVLLLGGSMAWAQIAAWDLDPLTGGTNDFGPSPYNATTTNANVVVGGLTRGSGVTLSGAGAGDAWGGNGFSAASLVSAVSSNDFVTFTITANSGYALSLSDVAAYNIRLSGAGPTSGQWQYKVGNGAFVDIGSTIAWGAISTSAGNPHPAINLSGIAALQNISAGTTVTFRVVNWGNSGNWYFNDPPAPSADNDLTINGSVYTCTSPPTAGMPTTATTCVDADLVIDGNPADGSGIYTEHLWTNTGGGSATGVNLNNTTAQMVTASASGAGTINLNYKVTDSNGCTGTKDVTVTVNPAPTGTLTETDASGISNNDNAICAGGSATFTATSGLMNYEFMVNGISVQNGASDVYTTTTLTDGADVSVEVTNALGCKATFTTATMTVYDLPVPMIVSQINVACYGATTGSVTISGGGFNGVYSIDGVIYSTSGSFTGLSAGDYTVIVKNVNGCSATQMVTISQPAAPLVASITAQADALCFAQPSGSVTVAGMDGTPPYTYSFDFGPYQPSGTFNSVAAGSYTIVVKDANNCTVTQPVIIGQPSALVGSESHTAIACFGGTSTVTISASGGTSPYMGTGTFTQSAGSQNYTVTDANGCSTVVTVMITQPTALSGSESHTAIACFGGTSTVTISATGGTAPYMGTGTFTQSAGSQNYTITDVNSCSTMVTATITQPTALSGSESHTAIACFGGTSMVTISASGGTSPYMGTGTFTQSAGSQNYTVTDANGCSTVVTATITQPTALVSSESHTAIACFGGMSTVTISATGGTSPYAGTGTFSQSAGSQNYTVTDANGCSTVVTATITQPSALVGSESHTAIACFGGTSTVTISATGGTSPYMGTGTFTQSAGSQNYTITDANGCSTVVTVVITQPGAGLAATSLQNTIICSGATNGNINLSVTGGTPGYSYNWSNGAITEDLTGLGAGLYAVTVTDANSCSLVYNVTLAQANALALSETHVNVDCNGNSTGSINLSVAGGGVNTTAPVGMDGMIGAEWTGASVKTVNYNPSAPLGNFGTPTGENHAVAYNVYTRQDANYLYVACQTNTGLGGSVSGSIQFANIYFGGNTSLGFETGTNPTTAFLPGGPAGISVASLAGGKYEVFTANNFSGSEYVTELAVPLIFIKDDPLGINFIKLDGSAGKSFARISLTQAFGYSVAGGQAAYGTNRLGSYSIPNNIINGTYTYNWSNAATTQDISALAAGTYGVTVTDDLGCQAATSVIVTQPAVLTTSISATNVSCLGGSNGTATVVVTGGTSSYTYDWTGTPTGEATPSISGLIAGTYGVTVTDANNCVTSTSIIVTEPTALMTSISATNASCFGGSNGTATVVVSGGTSPYAYDWTGSPSGEGTSSISGLIAGTYGVTVTDANGCIISNSVVVTQPTALTTSISSTNVSCFGGTNGTATVVVGGGTGAYTYDWTGSPTGEGTTSISGLIAGTYEVTVTDANGCTISTSVMVSQPAMLIAVESHTNATCYGYSNGTATINATGGTTPYTGTGSFTGLAAGTYSYTVMDANGCVSMISVTITQPAQVVVAPITGSNYVYTNSTTNLDDATTGGVWASSDITKATVDQTGLVTGVAQGTSIISYTVTDGNGCSNSATFTIIVDQPILDIGIFNYVASSPAGNKLKIKIRPTVSVVNGVYSDGVFTIRCATAYGVTFTNLGSLYGYTLTNTAVNDGGYDYFIFNFNNGSYPSNKVDWPANVEQDILTLGYSCIGNATFEIVTPYTHTFPGPINIDGGYYQELNAGAAQRLVYQATATSPAPLTITATSDSPACVGELINLSSTPSGGTGTYTAFAWSGPDTYASSMEDPAAFTASVAKAGIYTVMVTDGNSCTATNTTTVVVPVPAVTATGGSFNRNQTVVLTATAPTAVSYAWTGPNGYIGTGNPASPAPASNVISSGIYTVVVTDINGCTNSATATVVVYPAILYVNDNSQAGDVIGTTAVGNDNNPGTAAAPLLTIQKAIDVALSGDIINVEVGTYAQNLTVGKMLTINGPNALINPCSGTRVAEAIVVPGSAAISTGEIFHVAASNVTIKGFTIDGDNTAISSGFTSTNGADIDAAEGITVYETGVNNLTATNNIFKNLSYFGVTLDDYIAGAPSSGHVISSNKFQDLGTYDPGSGVDRWGGAVLLYDNQYAAVTNNCMDNVRLGVQTGNFYQANPGAAALIDGNTLTNVRRTGVFHNLHYGTASLIAVSGNTIAGTPNANETKWDGVFLSSLTVPSAASNNTINASSVTQPSSGIEVWNVKSTTPAAISGGSVTGASTGVFLNNYDGYVSNAVDGAHASIAGITINPTALGTGIRVFDSPLSTHANVQATIGAGVIINVCTNGLVVENTAAKVISPLGNLAFVGQTGNYIQLINNANDLNATTATFNGVNGGAASLAQNFAIEDKIVHKIDNAVLGFVLVKANHDFVTINSFSTPNTTPLIQRGVDAAGVGFTVNVGAGTFNEDVNANKQLTLLGAGLAATTVSGPIGGDAATFRIAASGVVVDGFNITRDGNNTTDWNNPGLNSIGLAVQGQTANVEVRNSKFEGNRSGIDINNSNGNNIHNNVITNNRTGIIFRNQTDNTSLVQNTITNNWTAGIVFLDASGGSNSPVQTAANSFFNNNDLSANWYAQIVDRQSGGSLPPAGTNLKNFECNWYGTTNPVVTILNSAEPGYAAQIPVVYGGTAVPPGGQPDIAGPASANFDYVSWLISGADSDGGSVGFQPAPNTCLGSPVVITLALQTNVSCFGTATGALDITPSGGSGNYSYLWSNMATTQDISGLVFGPYSLTLTDVTYGSTATATYTITQPTLLTTTSGSNTPQYAGSTLNLTSMPAGGTPGYTYAWSGPNGFVSMAQNPSIPNATVLANGLYTVTVTDAQGCMTVTSTSVIIYGTSLYVNDTYSVIDDHYTTAVGSNANAGTPSAPFATLTYAISIAQPGNTIYVDAGTYLENPGVAKALIIKGSNFGIDARGVRTYAESFVRTNGATTALFNVTASNVTIDGFTLDGDDPGVTTAALASGADANVSYLVQQTATGNNLNVSNNIMKRAFIGIRGSQHASNGNVVNQNWFDEIGNYDFGYAVTIRDNYYADITNNKMTKVWTGAHINNHSGTGGPASFSFTGNEVHSYATGLAYWLNFNQATPLTVNNNQFYAEIGAVANNFGILVVSLQDAVNPTFTNNTISGTEYGIGLFNVPTSNMVTLGATNSISGTTKAGILFTNNLNFNPVGTTNFLAGGPGAASTVKIAGIGLTSAAGGTGIVLDATAGTATTLNFTAPTTLNQGAIGLLATGSAVAITGNTLGNLTFVGQTSKYISLTNGAFTGQQLNATATLFDTKTGITATLAENFDIEDKIVHKIDDGTLGYVSVKASHDFVTENSYVAPATVIASIQRGVNAAANGYTVNVKTGNYTDNVIIDKEVSILGAGQGLTIVKPALSDPNCGGAGGGSLCAGSSNVMLVQANNVSIQKLTIDGDNTTLTSGIVSGGADLDARNGIITNHNLGVYNNLLVNNVTVKNIYLRGMYASSGGSFTFSNNIVDNVQASSSSIAMFNFGGSGTFTNNMVSNASDGIASNHSTGTTYSGNTVTLSGSGIHTDNNGDGGGTGDIIQNNTVTNSTTNGYGIWVFAPYLPVTVQNNTVNNVDVGLANAGQGAAVTTTFTGNTVDGMLKANSTGVYQTTNLFGFGTSNVSGVYTNNFIRNNTDGFYLEYEAGRTHTITANDNAITGNGNGVTLASGASAAGTLTNNFMCNWWGVTAAAAVAAEVGSPVNYTPWGTNGTDNSVAAGFQPVMGACSGTPLSIMTISDPITCGEPDGSIMVSFLGGTANYTVTWTGPSSGTSPSLPGSPYTITGLPAGAYAITVTDANGSTAVANIMVEYLPVTNVTQTLYYNTIQAAIDDATIGDVINVCKGTYAENLLIDKQLTIQGAKAGVNVNTRYAAFVAGKADPTVETIITASVNNPSTGSTNDLVRLAASGIILDGLVIDGNNPALPASGLTVNGTQVHARMGITNLSSAAFDGGESGQYVAGGLNVHHTIIQNLFRGMELSGPYLTPSRSTIANNLLRNFAPTVNDNGYAITLFYNFYADVINNTIDLTGSSGTTVFGVRQQNCDNTVSGGAVNFSNNAFTLGQNTSAFFINNNYGNANPLVVGANTINSAPGVVPDANERPRAITMWTSQQNSQVSFQNNVLGNSGGKLGRGYYLWGNSSNLVSISGGSVASAKIGISMHTDIGFGGASASMVAVSGTSISADTAGIRLSSSGGNANGNQSLQLTNVPVTVGTGGTGILISDLNADGFTMAVELLSGNSITGGTTGLRIAGTGAAITGGTLTNTAFSGQTGNYIELVNNAGNLNATAATFGGLTGAMASLLQNFAIEDKIVHKIDNAALGFVLVKAANDFVTTASFASPNLVASVQRGIDAASAGFTTWVADGTYNGDVNINKALTLQGQSTAATIRGLFAGNSKTAVISANNVTVKDLTITRDYGDWYSSAKTEGIIAENVTGVVMDNLIVKDNRNGIYVHSCPGFIVRNCTVTDNRTGFQIWGNLNGGQIVNNFINNNFTHGVLINFDQGNTTAVGLLVNENNISGNWLSQVNFQQTGTPGTNVGSLSGLSFSCNWYGTTSPTVNAVSAGVPGTGYGTQVPSQLGGMNPNLPNRYLMGEEAALIPYTPWSVNGTDNDVLTAGFQPVPGSCTGTPVVIVSAVPDHITCGEISGGIMVNYTGGTANYTVAWTGPSAGSMNMIAGLSYTIPSLAIGNYLISVTDANGSTATTTAQVLYLPVKNATANTYYGSIQAAINAATASDILEVCTGTYSENLIVNKSLDIRGPNYNVSPNGGVRVPEATILPATTDIDGLVMIQVQASNVSIRGFSIDGDNPALFSTYLGTNGADLDAYEAIGVVQDNISGLNVSKNIIRNISYFGVDLLGDGNGSAPATAGHLIDDNRMQDFGTYNNASGIALWGGGVLLYNNQYARVTNNTLTNMRIGIQTGNYSQANPGAATDQVIDNNTISARRRGIFHNLHYSAASPFTLSNNTITAVADANESVWDGILLASLSVPSTSLTNTINGSAVSNPSEGYEVWNVNSSSPASITGGSVSGVGIGLFVNNYDGYPSAGSNASFGGHAIVSGLNITPLASGVGIRLRDNPLSAHANVQLTIGTGVTITGGSKGLWLENASSAIVGASVSNLNFVNQTGNYIELVNNGGNLDATAATFSNVSPAFVNKTGATASLTENFVIEDKIVHKIDDGTLGFALVKANNDFVTPASFILPATTTPSIQRGVDAASNGFTVNVDAGTYIDNVLVNKEVTIDGAGYSTKVTSITNNGNIMTVAANNVTLLDLHLEGTPIMGSSATRGIYFNSAVTNIDVTNVKASLHQFAMYADNSADVNDLTVTNSEFLASGNGFQVENQGKVNTLVINGGAISDNLYGFSSTANSGATNNETGLSGVTVTGTTFSGNTLKGLYFEKLNSAAFDNITVTGNGSSATEHSAGMDINLKFGTYNGIEIKRSTFSGNGNANNNGGGILVKARISGGPGGIYGTNPATLDNVSIHNNYVTDNGGGTWGAGIRIGESNNSFTGTDVGPTNVGIHDNSITGNAVHAIRNAAVGAPAMVSADCNWYGVTNYAAVAAKISGNVDYTSWRVNGTDTPNDPNDGFQPDNTGCIGVPVMVSARVFLQGPYDSAPVNPIMNDALRKITSGPLFPTTEPYSQYNTLAFNFAFTRLPGEGGEMITNPAVLADHVGNTNLDIVDWVFLELRNKNGSGQLLATRSALLRRDGFIVDMDGTSDVVFPNADYDNYYVVVRHRNHLGAMTAGAVTPGMTLYDFSDPLRPTFGATTTSARKLLEPGVYGLIAGNTNLKANNVSFQVRYNGQFNDSEPILNRVGATTPLNILSGYYIEDVNLNGSVKYSGSNNDRVIILNNVGPTTPLTVITQQPPN